MCVDRLSSRAGPITHLEAGVAAHHEERKIRAPLKVCSQVSTVSASTPETDDPAVLTVRQKRKTTHRLDGIVLDYARHERQAVDIKHRSCRRSARMVKERRRASVTPACNFCSQKDSHDVVDLDFVPRHLHLHLHLLRKRLVQIATIRSTPLVAALGAVPLLSPRLPGDLALNPTVELDVPWGTTSFVRAGERGDLSERAKVEATRGEVTLQEFVVRRGDAAPIASGSEESKPSWRCLLFSAAGGREEGVEES